MPRKVLILAGLAALTVAVYWNVPGYDFVGIDDADYVTDNPRVLDGLSAENARWALTTTAESNWHPLTWLSLMLDGSLGGTARVFHTTNVVLHVAATLLLFLAVSRMTRTSWRAAFVAALFAVHPLHVESVAWISERKDVLSGLFWMAVLLAYARYVERPSSARYLACWTLLALGLLAKPMLVTLPLVLVLLDYWPLRRLCGEDGNWRTPAALRRVLVVEKLPLMIPVALSAGMTLFAQSSGGSMIGLERVAWPARLANALVSYGRYVLKTLLPVDLAIPYPYRPETLAVANVAAAAVSMLALTAAALRYARRFPWLAVGWGWFVIALVPVIGLVQVGSQSMADRYSYVPTIGLSLIAAWGGATLARRRRVPAPAVALVAGTLVLALALQARIQSGYWRDTTTLFTHTLAVTGDNAVAHDALGLERLAAGDTGGALVHFEEALRISPWNTRTRMNLAAASIHARRLDDALAAYAEVLRAAPAHPGALAGTGLAHLLAGDLDRAIEWMERAVRAEPNDATTHKRLALALVERGEPGAAREHFEAALRLDPGDAILRGRYEDALDDLSRDRTRPRRETRRTTR